MRQLYSARVEKQESVKDSLGFQVTIYTVLHLLRVDFSLLFRAVGHFVSVLHLWFLFFNLDHAIQISSFHRQHMHVLSFVRSGSRLAGARESSLVSKVVGGVRLASCCWVGIRSVRSLELIDTQVLVRHLVVIEHASSLDKRLLLLHVCVDLTCTLVRCAI